MLGAFSAVGEHELSSRGVGVPATTLALSDVVYKLIALLAGALWRFVIPGNLWLAGAGKTLALLLAIPGVVLLARAGRWRR